MIRRLFTLLAAHRLASELRVLLDCAHADLGSLRRELAARALDITRLTGAAAGERSQHAADLRACEATWAGRVTALERDLATSQDERARLAAELLAARDALATAQAESRDLNGRIRTLVGERDNAIAETHATKLALRRAELAGADTKRAAKRVARWAA